jgi:hypothetical protein
MALEDADIFGRAVGLLLEGRDDAAQMVLKMLASEDPIAAPVFDVNVVIEARERARAEQLNNHIRARIYKRDGWRCRYCSRKLVLPAVLELLRVLCPGFRGLLPGHHMPGAETEPAAERVYPNVDHIHPVSKGGAWRVDGNHVTACTPCNTRKSDRAGWLPMDPVPAEWDGLTQSYFGLAQRAGQITRYQREWFKALGITSPARYIRCV